MQIRTPQISYCISRPFPSISLSLLTALLTACDPNDSQYEQALLWKLKLFQNIESNLSKPVAARLQNTQIRTSSDACAIDTNPFCQFLQR